MKLITKTSGFRRNYPMFRYTQTAVAFVLTLQLSLTIGCGDSSTEQSTESGNRPTQNIAESQTPQWMHTQMADLAKSLVWRIAKQRMNVDEAISDSLLTLSQNTALQIHTLVRQPDFEKALLRELRKRELQNELQTSLPDPPTAEEIASRMAQGLEAVRTLLIDFEPVWILHSPSREALAQGARPEVRGFDWVQVRAFVEKRDSHLAKVDPQNNQINFSGNRTQSPRMDQLENFMLLVMRDIVLGNCTPYHPGGPLFTGFQYNWGTILDLPPKTVTRWTPPTYTHIRTNVRDDSHRTVGLPVVSAEDGTFSKSLYLFPRVEVHPVWGEVEIERNENNPVVRLTGKAPAVVLVAQASTGDNPSGRLLWIYEARTAQDKVLASSAFSVESHNQGWPARYWAETADPRFFGSPFHPVEVIGTVHYTQLTGGERRPPASLIGSWQSIKSDWSVEFQQRPQAENALYYEFKRNETSETGWVQHQDRHQDLMVEFRDSWGGSSFMLCQPLDADEDGIIDVVLWGAGTPFIRKDP